MPESAFLEAVVSGDVDAVRRHLAAGADPNARYGEYDLPVLYFVTGHRGDPGIARLLLQAGASPTDGESVFHAAEHFHVEALTLLEEFGVDLNDNGDWGNTPLYFLLRHHDASREPVSKGARQQGPALAARARRRPERRERSGSGDRPVRRGPHRAGA